LPKSVSVVTRDTDTLYSIEVLVGSAVDTLTVDHVVSLKADTYSIDRVAVLTALWRSTYSVDHTVTLIAEAAECLKVEVAVSWANKFVLTNSFV
jgi:hypothetical protein